MLGGVLFAQTWFDDEADPAEREIRALADQLYRAVEWDWITPRQPFVSMGWHPESGFIGSDWNIYNESLILYVLALGSPTHALPATTWDAWTAKFDPSWDEKYDNPFTAFPPLFGHQYSQVWIDFRGLMDTYSKRRGFDYFENSRRATYAQRRYAINNPAGWRGYGENVWGLTACDGPGISCARSTGASVSSFPIRRAAPATATTARSHPPPHWARWPSHPRSCCPQRGPCTRPMAPPSMTATAFATASTRR
ncbi:hypothetical protein GCM10020258_31130 [Sphingomonas yabuuchiae]